MWVSVDCLYTELSKISVELTDYFHSLAKLTKFKGACPNYFGTIMYLWHLGERGQGLCMRLCMRMMTLHNINLI